MVVKAEGAKKRHVPPRTPDRSRHRRRPSTLYVNVSAERRAPSRQQPAPEIGGGAPPLDGRWRRNSLRNSRPSKIRTRKRSTGMRSATQLLRRQTAHLLDNCGISIRSTSRLPARDGIARSSMLTQSTRSASSRTSAKRPALARGAGFPTGRKGRTCANSRGHQFVICNGDEGDPGAFMDRLIPNPIRTACWKGLAIADRHRATEGYLYIRAEYPKAVHQSGRHPAGGGARIPVRRDERGGGGTGHALRLEVRKRGRLERKRRETALRPISPQKASAACRAASSNPRSADSAARPTIINNARPQACVPWILLHGPHAFAASARKPQGNQSIRPAGKIRRGGLTKSYGWDESVRSGRNRRASRTAHIQGGQIGSVRLQASPRALPTLPSITTRWRRPSRTWDREAWWAGRPRLHGGHRALLRNLPRRFVRQMHFCRVGTKPCSKSQPVVRRQGATANESSKTWPIT